MSPSISRKLWKYLRCGMLFIVVSFLAAFVILFMFDLFRPHHTLSIGMLIVVHFWSILPLAALMAAVSFLTAWWLAKIGVEPRWLSRIKLAGWVGAALFFVPHGLFQFEGMVYQPLKFAYLIRRVEHASTVEEERDAFALASKWGRVFELHEIDSPLHLPERVRHLHVEKTLKLEWLESNNFGEPYRAYRKVIDAENLKQLR